MPKTLLFISILFMKQLNKMDRTCQNCYATHAFLGTYFTQACSVYCQLKFCTQSLLQILDDVST
jgi:hypothetical protein